MEEEGSVPLRSSSTSVEMNSVRVSVDCASETLTCGMLMILWAALDS